MFKDQGLYCHQWIIIKHKKHKHKQHHDSKEELAQGIGIQSNIWWTKLMLNNNHNVHPKLRI